MLGTLAVPEKFLDPATGEIRVEALLKSYLELEKRLSRSVALPDAGQSLADDDRTRLMAALACRRPPRAMRSRWTTGCSRPTPR